MWRVRLMPTACPSRATFNNERSPQLITEGSQRITISNVRRSIAKHFQNSTKLAKFPYDVSMDN